MMTISLECSNRKCKGGHIEVSDANEIYDGQEGTCHACNTVYVATAFEGDTMEMVRCEKRTRKFRKWQREIGNKKVVFGLVAQGHIPTIEKMLAEGNNNWYAIGRAIGWDGQTAERHYRNYLLYRMTKYIYRLVNKLNYNINDVSSLNERQLLQMVHSLDPRTYEVAIEGKPNGNSTAN